MEYSSPEILHGDALEVLKKLPDESVQCCVTSPPYWGLRDYGVDGQIGLEKTPEEYTTRITDVFREVRRMLRTDGVLWLNLGDSYATGAGKVGDCPGGGEQGERWKKYGPARTQVPDEKNPAAGIPTYQPNRMPLPGLKPKDLVGIPWRVAFALQADGWWLRQDIIWAKPNPMPESVRDRCTKAHEYLFLLSKSSTYYFDSASISEPSGGTKQRPRFGGVKYGDSEDPRYATKSGNQYRDSGTRNRRSVWSITAQPFPEAHFAVMPEKLVEPCVFAGSQEGDAVLDPFCGSGTVGVVCARLGRRFIGVDINGEYIAMAKDRIFRSVPPLFAGMG